MILGRNLIIAIDGVAIAASKSCKVSVRQNFIDTCPPTDARTTNKVPTTYDWNLSSDCLVASSAYANSILDLVISGAQIFVQFYDVQLEMYRSGNAFIQGADITGSVGSLTTLNVSIIGSGPLNSASWNNIFYSLDEVTHDIDILSNNSFKCNNGYPPTSQRIFIATKEGNQYIRYDTVRTGDDWDIVISDDAFTRQTSFKGGQTQLYIVVGTISGDVITADSVCSIRIPSINILPNTWFNIRLSAFYEDPREPGDSIFFQNIEISKADSQ